MTAELTVSLAVLFASIAVLAGTAASMVVRRHAPERKRLRDLARAPEEQRPRALRTTQLLTDAPNALAERICRILPRSATRMDQMRARLLAAGFRSQGAPVALAASQIVSSVAVGGLLLAVGGNVSVALVSMVVGFLLPDVWLAHQVTGRGAVIRNGLPDVLDLLIVCLESGCSLDQAILRSGEELAIAYKPLGEELALVANEIRAGKPRSEAFTRFAERTKVDDVRSLVAMLIQTDRYGTSIAQALRNHADLLRTRRRQRAEERAGKASVKLVFPLVLCLFPAFYLITLGPAILQFVRVFFSAVGAVE
jgi:tight adherence protein C